MASGVLGLSARLAALEKSLARFATQPQLGHSSLEGGAIGINDDFGVYHGALGTQYDGTVALTVVNGPTPPRPAAPTVVGFADSLSVTSDGNWVNEDTGLVDALVVAPEDFARLEVHLGATADFEVVVGPESATRRGTIETPAGASVNVGATPGTYWVRLVCVTTSGKFAVSDAVEGTAISVLGQDVVDQLTQDIADTNTRIDNLQTGGAGAIPSHDVAPTIDDTAAQGTIWRQVDAGGNVIAVFEQTAPGTASTWTPRLYSSLAIVDLDVSKLVVGEGATISDLVAETIAGKTAQFMSISADQIQTGTLAAGVSITAGDPAGERTVLDNDGITSFAADDTILLDTSGGFLTLGGDITLEGAIRTSKTSPNRIEIYNENPEPWIPGWGINYTGPLINFWSESSTITGPMVSPGSIWMRYMGAQPIFEFSPPFMTNGPKASPNGITYPNFVMRMRPNITGLTDYANTDPGFEITHDGISPTCANLTLDYDGSAQLQGSMQVWIRANSGNFPIKESGVGPAIHLTASINKIDLKGGVGILGPDWQDAIKFEAGVDASTGKTTTAGIMRAMGDNLHFYKVSANASYAAFYSGLNAMDELQVRKAAGGSGNAFVEGDLTVTGQIYGHPYTSLYVANTWSAPSGITTIPFDSGSYSGFIWDNTAKTLKIQKPGLYTCTVQANTDSNSYTGYLTGHLYKNGSSVAALRVPLTGSAYASVNLTKTLQLAAGDTISGGTLIPGGGNFRGGANETWMTVAYVGTP